MEPRARDPHANRERNDTVEHLQSFLRGELAAVETYQKAIASPTMQQHERDALAWCQRSHHDRIQRIGERLRLLGAEVPATSGSIGRIIEIVGDASMNLGEGATIQALERYENLRLRDYGRDIPKIDAKTQAFVEYSLLPAQVETHRILQLVKRRHVA